jgi:hypothetical protein
VIFQALMPLQAGGGVDLAPTVVAGSATLAPEIPAVKRSKGRRDSHTLRLWAFEDAQAAVPYIASVMRSLREHYVEIQSKRHELSALADRPGRPNRTSLIAEQEARRAMQKAESEYQDALDELQELDIQPLDPSQGTALVPFVHDDQLAWYVFDLFDSQPIRSWRYQTDPDETRRKLTAAQMR